MASNIANTVNFGTTGLNVGDYTYSLYALSAPGYLPLNSYTNSYLVSSYTALGALIVPVITPVAFAATARTMSFSGTWTKVVYGNGLFVAFSASSSQFSTSPDGITWTTRTLPAPIAGNNILGAAFGNGVFVITFSGANVGLSNDGINWRTAPITSSAWSQVVFGNGLFVTVSSTSGTTAASSPDGVTWTIRTLPSTASWYSVGFGNGVFVATLSGASTTGAVSLDGITWTAMTMPSSLQWQAFAYGNGKILAIPRGPTTVAATSVNGADWTTVTLPSSSDWVAGAYGNNSFLITAISSTAAATSPDGVTWTARTMPSVTNYSVVFATGKFVATGTTTNAATIDYAVNATSFVLPVVAPKAGTTAYVKAT